MSIEVYFALHLNRNTYIQCNNLRFHHLYAMNMIVSTNLIYSVAGTQIFYNLQYDVETTKSAGE